MGRGERGFSNPMGSLGGKGKAVMFTDDPPVLPRQHVNSLDGENVDDWKQFKEAGYCTKLLWRGGTMRLTLIIYQSSNRTYVFTF
ncbi:hypothetical protein SLEP1_g51137 [Rubroshorea leprosula]|uniref:Uncharacterized protein n=1 Tax=Rubroshorea leprosula TaxID=152421 RepID=A0AAV5M2G1_9ROSI|nr:hypothetical protein SLEP1_g51137 [Rubroshorea leprosula]